MNTLAALLIWIAQTTGVPTDTLLPPPDEQTTEQDSPAIHTPPPVVGASTDAPRIYNGI